jgi:hypothetical protein
MWSQKSEDQIVAVALVDRNDEDIPSLGKALDISIQDTVLASWVESYLPFYS